MLESMTVLTLQSAWVNNMDCLGHSSYNTQGADASNLLGSFLWQTHNMILKPKDHSLIAYIQNFSLHTYMCVCSYSEILHDLCSTFYFLLLVNVLSCPVADSFLN